MVFRDHLGKPVTMCRARELPERAAESLRSAMSLTDAEFVRRLFWNRWLVPLVFAIWFVVSVVLSVWGVRSIGAKTGASLAACVLVFFALGWQRRRSEKEATFSRLLNDAICPACGYDLKLLGFGPDGYTRCPECGAAWALAREYEAR